MFSQRHSVLVFVISLCTCMPLKLNAQQQYNRISANTSDRHFIVNNNEGVTKSSNKPHNDILYRNDTDSSNNIINNIVLKHQQQQRLKQEQTEWKPLKAQKEWFIMQPTVVTVHRDSHKQSQLYQQSHQQHTQQPHPRLPVNYYAYSQRYNHSIGNYKHVVTQSALPTIVAVNVNSNDSNSRNNSNSNNINNINNINNNEIGDNVINANHQQPFVLAIDKSMKHNSVSKRPSHLMPQHDKNLLKKNIIARNNDFGDVNTLMPSDAIQALQEHKQQQQPQQQQLNHHQEVSSTYIGSNDITTNAKYAAGAAPTQAVTDNANDYILNEFLASFEFALEKVRNFCESVKSIINNSDNKSVNSDDEYDNEIDDIVTAWQDVNDISTEIASNEVQGRQDFAAAPRTSLATSKTSSISSMSTFAGSSRKLKKKLKKLLFPLLIAYKLKFLTLIPVLIGGLTLLVGTTGLAGFFFALFTAVMSLKSTSDSKSYIVKKIL